MSDKESRIKISADGSQAVREFERVGKASTDMGNSIGNSTGASDKAVGGLSGTMQSFFGNIMANLATKALGLVKDSFQYVIKTGAEFEYQMGRVSAITGATGEEFTKLEGFARDLAKSAPVGATAVAEAMEYMGMAGWDATQIMAGLPAVLQLSVASGVEMARVSDIVTDNLTAFGLSADDATWYSNILAKAVTGANVSVETLGQTLKYVAPVASGAGFAVEDTVGAIMALGDAGIKGSQAGTTLRTIMLHLTGANEKATKALKDLGIEIYNTDGTVRPLADIVGQLSDKLVDANGNVDTTTANLIVGKTAVSGFTALLKAGKEKLEDYSDGLRNADGALDEMSATMENTVQGSWAKFKSAIEESALTIWDTLKPAIKGAIDMGTELLASGENVYPMLGTYVGESTHKQIGHIGELIDELNLLVTEQDLLGKTYTPAMVAEMSANYDKLFEYLTSRVNDTYDETTKTTALGLMKQAGLSQDYIDITGRQYDYHKQSMLDKVTSLETRKNEIISMYGNVETAMRSEHASELQKILADSAKLAIDTLSQENADKLSLMESYGNGAIKITQANYKTILESAQKTRDEVVKTAQKKLEEEVQASNKLKEMNAISDEAYKKMVDEAVSSHDKAVKEAETGFGNVAKECKTQLEGKLSKEAETEMNKYITKLTKGNADAQKALNDKPVEAQFDDTQAIKDAQAFMNYLNKNVGGKTVKVTAQLSTSKARGQLQDLRSGGGFSSVSMPTLQSGLIPAGVSPMALGSNSNSQTINMYGNYKFDTEESMDTLMQKMGRMLESNKY